MIRKKWYERLYSNVTVNRNIPSTKGNSGLYTFCLEWQGACDQHGYGCMGTGVSKKTERTHRLAYRYYHGNFPNRNEFGERIFICHHCDNPKCCSDEHLFLGTAKDNSNDMINKNRDNFTGSKKLTDDEVQEILSLVKDPELSFVEIGKRFGVSRGTIARIQRGFYWKHIPRNTGSKPRSQGSPKKLTKEKVIQILELLSKDEFSDREIGEMFGVVKSMIASIRIGKTWQRIPRPLMKPRRMGRRPTK